MKYIEYYYVNKERYKKEMSRYTSVKKSSMERQYYRLKKHFEEHLFSVDELKSLVSIQHLKLILFHDMRRLKGSIDDEILRKNGFDYDEIQLLKERGLI